MVRSGDHVAALELDHNNTLIALGLKFHTTITNELSKQLTSGV